MLSRGAQEITTTHAARHLLYVENLTVHFPARGGPWLRRPGVVKAVDQVSFTLAPGATLGLVGESGCGKTTLARAILRLIPATGGKVYFDGQDVFALPPRALRRLRRQVQIVFQDPFGSLNPRLTVETLVGEALTVHRLIRDRAGRRRRVAELLSRVGLSSDAMTRYPHEFSGGQRQRIGIARALALEPKLVICDEPVSALDVSIQSQILNLLADLQGELGLSYLLIAHNLAVVRHCSDAVGVMYLGRIVEHAPAEELFTRPAHPYTRALLAAVPEPAVPRQAPATAGSPPPAPAADPLDPSGPAGGCAYHPRCPWAEPMCRQVAPPLREYGATLTGHQVACHLAERMAR